MTRHDVDEREQFEDAEDTDEAERTEDEHRPCVGQEVGLFQATGVSS